MIKKHIISNLKYLRRPSWDRGVSPPELLITLAEHGWEVSGVDIALIALYRAHKKAKAAKVKLNLHLGDVSKLRKIHGKFDLALDIGCFHTLGEKKEDYLNRLDEILTPNGFWLLYAHLLPRKDGATHGLSPEDFEMLNSRLSCIWRKDNINPVGYDAAWVLFQKS